MTRAAGINGRGVSYWLVEKLDARVRQHCVPWEQRPPLHQISASRSQSAPRTHPAGAHAGSQSPTALSWASSLPHRAHLRV
jgi:hypothetical protein